MTCFWTDLVGCAEDCGSGPPPDPTCDLAHKVGSGTGGNAIGFRNFPAGVVNAVLTSAEIRYDAAGDYNGCTVGPSTAVYSSGGPFSVTYHADGAPSLFNADEAGAYPPVFVLDSATNNSLPDFVAGASGSSGGWYGAFVVTDTDTMLTYTCTGTYTTCF